MLRKVLVTTLRPLTPAERKELLDAVESDAEALAWLCNEGPLRDEQLDKFLRRIPDRLSDLDW